MLAKDLLALKNRDTLTAIPSTLIHKAMSMLIDNKISCLPILDGENLIGIVSDKDIFTAIHDDLKIIEYGTVGELMTEKIIFGVFDDHVDYIAGLMTQNKIRHIPIVDDSKLVGLLSIGDIVKARMDGIEVENRYLMNYISGNYPG